MSGAADVDSAIAILAKRVPVVAVKCGSRGSLVQAGEDRWSVAGAKVTPVDTIGAGDSFNAGFLKGYLDGLALPACAALGNATAAFSTLRPGGTESFRDKAFLNTFLAEQLTSR